MDTSSFTELGFRMVTLSSHKAVTGCFCGDLLSWVMGRAKSGDCWFTIMGNMNAVAVASLLELSAIVLCQGVTMDDAVIQKAAEEELNIFYTDLSVYDAATAFYEYSTGKEK